MEFAPLVGKQRQSVQLATARSNVFEGAVRSSKTVSTIMKWLRYNRAGPAGPLLMVGKTERTLKRNIIDPIQEMVGTKRCRFKAGAGEIDLMGRTIYVAGAHDESSADRIKGMTLAGAYGDEITTWPESFYSMLMTRLSIPGAQFFGTTNPAAPTHWLMKKYLKRARLHLDRDGNLTYNDDPEALNLHRFTFQLSDNPNLTPEYVTDISREFTGMFYRRYVLGEWVLAEGAVFDRFDFGVHVVPELPPILRWLSCGVDHGSTNPFAGVLIGLGVDGILYAVSEYRYDPRTILGSKSDPEYADAVADWLSTVPVSGTALVGVDPEYFIVDPAAKPFRTVMDRRGWTVTKGNNAVLDGIQTLSSLFALGALKIHESCECLLDEIPSYSWDDKAAERGEDAPIKVDDHSVDALRYAVHTTRAIWRPLLRPDLQLAA